MTVRDQIKALGGPETLAQIIEVNGKKPTPGAIVMWGVRGWIPYRWKAPVAALLEARSREAA